MREVCEFKTIEEFWLNWTHLPRPSEVFTAGGQTKEVEGRIIDGYSIFKKGIRPEWEDKNNAEGGEFSVRKYMQPELLDAFWENMVLGLIGETIEDADEICGCRVADKSGKGKTKSGPMYLLELWIKIGVANSDTDRLKSR